MPVPPPPAPPGPPISPAGAFTPDDPGAYTPTWRHRRFPLWLPLAAGLVVVLGGLAGWYLTGSHGTNPLTSAGASSHATPSGAGGSAQAATAHSSSPPSPIASAVSPTVATTPTPGATTTAGTGGSSVVALSPAVSDQPATAAIAGFLGQYFTAINQHDYQAYISLFTPAAQQGESAATFSSGSSTARDSRETLVALSPARHGKTAATITFVSHQDPAQSATHTTCTTWQITLYLHPAGTSYLIGVPPGTYRASAKACP